MTSLLFILTSLFVSFSSDAQTKGTYSWEDCIRLAIDNNAEILSAEKNLQSNQYLADNAKGYFLPTLSYNLEASRSDFHALNQPIVTNDVRTIYQGSLVATENLFSGFRDYARVKQAKANTRATEALLRITKSKISFDLKSNFQGLVYAKNYSRLTQDIIRRRRDNMSLVDLRYRSGHENKGSLLLAQAYYSQSKFDDLQANNAQTTSRTLLAKALGLDETGTFDIQGVIPIHDVPVSPDFKDLALKTPQHDQASAQWDAAEYGITYARSGFLPSLDLTAQWERSDYQLMPDQRDGTALMVNLTVPLFNGFRDYTNVRSSSALAAAAQGNFVTVNRQLLSAVTQAYTSYQEAVLRFQVATDFKHAAEVRADIARKKYNNGLLTFDEWDIIESDLINRQKDYLVAERDRTIAEASWEQALGEGVIP